MVSELWLKGLDEKAKTYKPSLLASGSSLEAPKNRPTNVIILYLSPQSDANAIANDDELASIASDDAWRHDWSN